GRTITDQRRGQLRGAGGVDQEAPRGAVSRARLFTFGAVMAATVVLAVLGYVSLRQWQASAELLFREQSRDMVTMAAEKVEMAILKAEEECLSSLQAILMEPTLRPEALDEWRKKNAIFASLTLVDRQG